MSTHEHDTRLEILSGYQRATLDMSADDLADLYAIDATHELPFRFPGMAAAYAGREQIRRAYRHAWGASPARADRIEQISVHFSHDPEVVLVEQVVHGINTATTRAFSFPGILLLRVRDGQIVNARDYMDAYGVAEAMNRLDTVLNPTADRRSP